MNAGMRQNYLNMPPISSCLSRPWLLAGWAGAQMIRLGSTSSASPKTSREAKYETSRLQPAVIDFYNKRDK